jgi:hypothetical protein
MTNNPATQAFEPVTNLVVLPTQPSPEPSAESNSTLVGSDANSYRTDEPQFTKAIAEHYGVTRKSVQEWVLKIREACPWFVDADLKLPGGQHTPLMLGLIEDFRSSGLPLAAWKDKIWAENPELVEAWKSQQAQPPQSQQLPDANASAITPFQVEVGNHQQTLPSPELPAIYTLQGLRANESIQIDDPLALANQVVRAIDLVQNVMKTDLQNREQKLKDTQKAKRLIDEKVQELKFEQRFYQEKANQIDSTQTETTQTLQDALSVLQTLGKPNVETPADSAS